MKANQPQLYPKALEVICIWVVQQVRNGESPEVVTRYAA
jgi:hypothetical protein